jgi:phosphate starvation-inducible PhoH-like protein
MSQRRARNEAREAREVQSRHPVRNKVNKDALSRFEPKTPGQVEYLKLIENHPITLAIGPAGTGKTYLAVVSAVRALIEGKFNKIVLTRPAIEAAGERLGALPGDEKEKIFPYLRPLYDSLEKILGRQEVTRLIEMGIIEILPLAYMRGMSLENSFIIIDEAQNASTEQFKMLLTRLGKYSKLVATGDLEQSDIDRNSKRSGLEDAVLRFAEENEIAVAHLGMADIQRHALVCRIIKGYKVKLPSDIRYESLYENE